MGQTSKAAVLRLTDETDAHLSHYVVVDLSDRLQPVVVNDATVSVGTPALGRYLDMQGYPVIVMMSKSGRERSGNTVDPRPHATELMRQLSFLELCKASGHRETDAFLSEDRAGLGGQVPVEKRAAKLEAKTETLRGVAALIADFASERFENDAQPNTILGQQLARSSSRQLATTADSKLQATASGSSRQQAAADSELQPRQQAAADRQERPSGAQTHRPMQLHPQMGHAADANRTDAFDSTPARGGGEASAFKPMTQQLPEQIASDPCWKVSRSAQELRPGPQGHVSASLGPTMRAQPQPPQQQQQDLEMQEALQPRRTSNSSGESRAQALNNLTPRPSAAHPRGRLEPPTRIRRRTTRWARCHSRSGTGGGAAPLQIEWEQRVRRARVATPHHRARCLLPKPPS